MKATDWIVALVASGLLLAGASIAKADDRDDDKRECSETQCEFVIARGSRLIVWNTCTQTGYVVRANTLPELGRE